MAAPGNIAQATVQREVLSPLHPASGEVRLLQGRVVPALESNKISARDGSGAQGIASGPNVIDNPPKRPLPSTIGRRAAPRLRLSLPGQLIAVDRVHRCIVLNLSRTGAQVAILDAVREGEGAILRCGDLNCFAIVTRSEFGLNALEFDEPITNEAVLEIRSLYENYEERERRALVETARKWVSGETDDDCAS
jgi:hypothetical protein